MPYFPTIRPPRGAPASRVKSQSAMEYLMTYGWAILVIAVVLGILFQLGVFGNADIAPKSQPGSCQVQKTAAGISLEGMCQGELPQYVGSFPYPGGNWQAAITSGSGTTSSATLAFWWWITNEGAVISDGGSCDSSLFGFSFSDGSINSYLPNCYGVGNARITVYTFNSANQNIGQTATVNGFLGKWGQVIVTFNSIAATIYINGALDSTYPFSQSLGTFALSSIAMYPLNSSIADIQVYNTSLSAAEAQALYQEGIGGAPVRPQNIVGWWPLNSNSNDYSGNNNNGRIVSNVGFSSMWTTAYSSP